MHETSIPSAIPFRTHPRLSGSMLLVLGAMALIGVAAGIFTLIGDDPDRFWPALLVNWLFWTALSAGMVVLAVALHLTAASWAWSIRRFALAGVAFLPVALALLVLVFFGSEIYFHEWLEVVRGDVHDAVVEAKAAWLNLPALIIRDLLGLALLVGLAIAFAVYSLRIDVHGVGARRERRIYGWVTRGWRGMEVEPDRSHALLNRLGVAYALMYALILGMLAVDLAMTLEPHWFSTMFPVAFFVTGFHGALAMVAVVLAFMVGRLDMGGFITPRQYHDLGKLIFGFSVFWMYINWSQYIVIWYGLLPMEQEWMVHRFTEPYATLVFAAVVCAFLLPFIGLLTRPPKKVPAVLGFFGVVILIGHWIERFLLVYPSLRMGEEAILPGVPEIGMAIGFAGLFGLCYIWFLSTFPVLPSPATLRARGENVILPNEPTAV